MQSIMWSGSIFERAKSVLLGLGELLSGHEYRRLSLRCSVCQSRHCRIIWRLHSGRTLRVCTPCYSRLDVMSQNCLPYGEAGWLTNEQLILRFEKLLTKEQRNWALRSREFGTTRFEINSKGGIDY